MKRHFLLSMMCITACLLATMKVAAYDYVENGIYYDFTDYDDGTGVASVVNNGNVGTYSGDVIIPESVTYNGKTYPVRAIGYQAFSGSSGMTSVKLPEGIAYMMNQAFADCTGLTSITLPSTLSSIYNQVFKGCTGLISVTCTWSTARSCNANNFDAATYQNATLFVPKGSLSSYQNTAPWSSFANIQENTKIYVNGIYYLITGATTASVTYRDKTYNTYSGAVNIPSTVTHNGTTYRVTAIDTSAFRACEALTAVTIPTTVTAINYAAFYQCSALTSVTVPSSVTELGQFCFQNCPALQTVQLNGQVTAIPKQCFTQCRQLQSVTLPSTIKDIGTYAFYECESLATINLPEGLESIGYSAFRYCESLTSVNIPGSVTQIGQIAFQGCTNMNSFSVHSSNQHYRAVDGVLMNFAADTLITYPNKRYADYTIPSCVRVIHMYSFSSCDNIVNVTIPNSVTTIEGAAFSDCTNMQSVTIPNSVTYIGDQAFASCNSLTSIHIPSSTTFIGDGAFAMCIKLVSILVDENNTNFMSDDGVLYTHDGRRLIQYPCARPDKHYSVLNTTDTIGDRAFAYTIVKSVYLPKSLRHMVYMPFISAQVERVVIDEGLENIPVYAFHGCEDLQSIYLPSTIKVIDQQAFAYSYNLSDITIAVNGNAPIIGENAFYGLAYSVPGRNANVYVPSGMASQYNGVEDWLEAMSTFYEITPVASGTTFTVDSLEYVTTDNLLNAKVSGSTVKTLLDPGIPPKVSYQGNLCTVTAMGYSSLQNCTNMVRAEVPFTVSLIDSYSFYGCTNLGKLRLHEGLEQINSFAVSHVDEITTLTLPASANNVNGSFVTYSRKLKEILVENGNTEYVSLDGVLFTKDRTRLVSFPMDSHVDYAVPEGTQVIGGQSFRGATKVASITFPSTLTTIENSAFYDNSSLTQVVIPDGVQTMGNLVFYGCTRLERAELPATLISLGYNAFARDPNLTNLVVKATTPPTCMTYINPRTGEVSLAFMEEHFTQCTLYVPRGSKTLYQSADTWENFINIVEVDFPAEAMRGDVNNDGQVNITDVTSLIDYLLSNNPSGVNLGGADTNLDGNINITDVTSLIDYLLCNQWPTNDIDMWYLIGTNVGSHSWENNAQSVGFGLIPLYPQGEFDRYGHGVLTYSGNFGQDDRIMLIHVPGNADDKWGVDPITGRFTHSPDAEPWCVEMGDYYTITLDTRTDQLTIEHYTADNLMRYDTMCMPGSYMNWDVTDTCCNMTVVNTRKMNHDWMMKDITFDSYTELKFAADNSWEQNWGKTDFPFGIGESNGPNIPVEAGTYDIFFNDITHHYNFIKK